MLFRSRLALDQEARAIQVALERSAHRDKFELVTRWAAQPLDSLAELRKLKPTIVHFSGHGDRREASQPRRGASPHRDVAAELPGGILFQGHGGQAQAVSAEMLEDTLGSAGSSVKLVVLNACF